MSDHRCTGDPPPVSAHLCGLAIAKGMPYERALEAVTINPARVMGVEDRVGNLAAGKDADLVIWKDKPFVVIQDPVAVFINGERV